MRVFLCDPLGRQYFNKASALPWTDAGSYGSAPRFEERSLTQDPAGTHPCGGPLGEAEPWCLTTNLTLPARAISRLYGKRFQIEETFRDQKCSRLGFALSEITMHSAERLEKLLLIVVLAQLLALFVGAIARQRGLDRGFRANTGHQQTTHSDFTLGLYYLWRIHWTLRELIKLRALEPCSLFGG